MSKDENREKLEFSKFLNKLQDMFTDDVLGKVPPQRGINDHSIDLVPKGHHLTNLLIEFYRLNKGIFGGKQRQRNGQI